MKESLRQAAGSLLVVGLGDKELTAMERAWLKLVRPAGIILFKRNIVDRLQTRALLAEATSFCPTHCGAFVDVEGGTVDRLRDVLAPIPSVQVVAQAARATGRAAIQREHGELVARAVKAFGFNSSFAPVVDLALPESRKVMGTRCAAETGAGVAAYAREFFAGLAAQGVTGCGKHFPGLGGGTLDSHLETPKIERTWRQLWQEDLEPYRALRDQMPMVMVNHAAYPLTADPKRPATVSKFWMQTVLRKRIGYRGIVCLRRSGDGRRNKIHAHRRCRDCHCAHGRRPRFNLPPPRANFADVRSADSRRRAFGGVPQDLLGARESLRENGLRHSRQRCLAALNRTI